MAPRAHWKGYLKLSLVSCPIALYPAISAAERVSFRQVNRQTGHRLRQQLVDSVTGEVVPPHNKGRGYEVGEEHFLLVKDEELEAAREEARTRPYSSAPANMKPLGSARPQEDDEELMPRRGAASNREEPRREEAPPVAPPAPVPVIENNRTIEIERFVPRAQIDPRYHDTPYYIAPREQVGLEAFAVIRDAMRGKEMVGMGRVVLAKRERPIIVEPMGSGLRAMTLRYAHEVKSEAEYFAAIPEIDLPDEMLRVAEHILETKTADFDPAFLEDRYRTVLVSMLREKHAELPKKIATSAPSRQNVINLMDALKRSLAAERPQSRTGAPKATPGRPARGPKSSQSRRSNARARRTA
jgi:non-homologous end joining protein Ku